MSHSLKFSATSLMFYCTLVMWSSVFNAVSLKYNLVNLVGSSNEIQISQILRVSFVSLWLEQTKHTVFGRAGWVALP